MDWSKEPSLSVLFIEDNTGYAQILKDRKSTRLNSSH